MCGVQCGHSMSLAFAGLVTGTAVFEGEASFLSLHDDKDLGSKKTSYSGFLRLLVPSVRRSLIQEAFED